MCCPSRASILTGQYVHNHHVIDSSISGGCSSLGWQAEPEKHSVSTYLKDLGYTTYYSGKYLNRYGDSPVGGGAHVPPGWDEWLGLLGNSVYYDYTLSANGKPEKHGDTYSTDYLTDVLVSTSEMMMEMVKMMVLYRPIFSCKNIFFSLTNCMVLFYHCCCFISFRIVTL